MGRLFARSGRVTPPLPPYARQRLDGWVRMLDVDLELAQRMLRISPLRMPLPPLDLPAVLGHDGSVLAEAVVADYAAPVDVEPEARPAAALRGAYARRAAARSG